jgi:hypothetical protein
LTRLLSTFKSLAGIVPAAPAPPQDPEKRQPEVGLQPHGGLVILPEGTPWTGYLTLANPGTTAIRGILKISGAPLTTKVDGETGDIRVTCGGEGEEGNRVLPAGLRKAQGLLR